MNEYLHVVCPGCLAVNRLPVNRLQQEPKCGQCHQMLFTGRPLEFSGSSFEKHLSRNDILVLIDFWAAWCGPCKMMAPAFAQASQMLEPLVRLGKVNTESEQQLSARFGVRSIPTLILFKGGREIGRQAGAMAAQDIVRWVKGHL